MTQEITAVAGDREGAVEMYHQMQLSISGGGGEAADMAIVTRLMKARSGRF